MADVNEQADSRSTSDGRVETPVEVTPPTVVFHLVRDLRDVLTDEQVAEQRRKHEEAGDKTREAAEEDLEVFLKGFGSVGEVVLPPDISSCSGNVALEDFDPQKWVLYRSALPGSAHGVDKILAGKAALRRHLGFFTVTFYINLLPRKRRPSWDELDPVPEAEKLYTALRRHIQQNKPGYCQIVQVLVENVEQDYRVYDELETLFPSPLYNHASGSMVGDREAFFWTDFLHVQDNCTRIFIRNRERSEVRLGRLVRRLLAVCTYSTFIMDAKPRARGQLSFMRDRLRHINELMKSAENIDDNSDNLWLIYKRLAEQASYISAQITDTRSRFTASAAYWQIVRQRLAEMDEKRIASFPRLVRDVEKHVKPVADNCVMAIQCQTGMAKQVEQVAEIVRTKVDIIRSDQNAEIKKRNRNIERVAKIAAFVGAAYTVIRVLIDTDYGQKDITLKLNDHVIALQGWWPIVVFMAILGAGASYYWYQYRVPVDRRAQKQGNTSA